MGKIERAIKALEALPPERRDEIADIVLDLATAASSANPALTEAQRAEVRRRQALGFQAADPLAIDRLIESFK